jgi:integrase/recombinase XerD
MSLTIQLDRYLSVRRSLGYDLGTAARILRVSQSRGQAFQ